MSQLGDWLRETRQAQELSLESIEAHTRIRRAFLQALEEGNYRLLPGEVFVRGFLRNYALHLGLDPAEVHRRYLEETGGRRDQDMAEAGFRPVDVALTSSTRLTAKLILGVLLALLLIGLAALGVWYWIERPTLEGPAWWPRLSNPAQSPPAWERTPFPQPSPTAQPLPPVLPVIAATTVPPTATAPPTPPVVATSAVLPLPTPTAPPTPTPTPEAVVLPPGPEGIELRIRVVERAWVRIMVDGQVNFEGVLQSGEEHTWQGRQSIALRCGNAGGIVVTVNGQELGLLGERGQVVDQEWTVPSG